MNPQGITNLTAGNQADFHRRTKRDPLAAAARGIGSYGTKA